MITSIEPGVYRPGQWGVRIENLVLNVPAATPDGSTFGEFLDFETLTLCPIDTRCIDRALLRDDEIAWLNGYHATVRERLAPRVQRRRAGLAASAHPADLMRAPRPQPSASTWAAPRSRPCCWPPTARAVAPAHRHAAGDYGATLQPWPAWWSRRARQAAGAYHRHRHPRH